MYLYIPAFASEPSFTGFRGVLRDANMPVPDAQAHKDALEGGFLPSMTEEEQKRFTPSELLLYKHALEYRSIIVHTKYILMFTGT